MYMFMNNIQHKNRHPLSIPIYNRLSLSLASADNNKYKHREIFLNHPEIRLYLLFSDWFGTKRISVWLIRCCCFGLHPLQWFCIGSNSHPSRASSPCSGTATFSVGRWRGRRASSGPVVLNIGSIKPQGFGESVNGVQRQEILSSKCKKIKVTTHIFFPTTNGSMDASNSVPPTRLRTTALGILMDQIRAPFKHRNTIITWCARNFRAAPNWVPTVPRRPDACHWYKFHAHYRNIGHVANFQFAAKFHILFQL